MRETIVASMQKRMRVNRKYAEDVYEEYNQVFSYPPRLGRDGLQDVLEIMARQVNKLRQSLK